LHIDFTYRFAFFYGGEITPFLCLSHAESRDRDGITQEKCMEDTQLLEGIPIHQRPTKLIRIIYISFLN
jgi:hypothetical protein